MEAPQAGQISRCPMPYLTGFNNDIFISYASVDNDPDAQGVRWVSRFYNDIETALRRRLGRDVEIFFDQTDFRATNILPQLLESARESAIFLAVCSPSYVEREWTRAELKAFHDAAKDSGGPNRLITIEVLPVDAGSLPSEFESLKRTRFYNRENDAGIDIPLTPESDSRRYNERLQQFASDLVLLLRDLHKREEAAAATERGEQASAAPVRGEAVTPALARGEAVAPGPVRGEPTPEQAPRVIEVSEPAATVLLAQVTDDVYDERQKVAAYLQDYKIRVVPVGEYPDGGAKFASAVIADLQNADLFVQLLGRVRSNKPEDLRGEGELRKSYAQFQYDAARRRGIPILQWRHPDIVVDNIPPVNWDRQLLQSSDVRVMGLQEFMKEVRGTVDQLSQKPDPKPVRDGFIFINADRSDQELAQTLFKALNDNACSAFLPMDDSAASAKEIQDDLEASLIDCTGVFLLYGHAPVGWVRAQSRQIMKIESRREEPLRVKTIVCGPPPAKPDPGVAGFQLINWQDGATAERVGRIIRELRV